MKSCFQKIQQNYVNNYTSGIIFCKERKTCTKMGASLEVPHDKVYRFLQNAANMLSFFPEKLTNIAYELASKNRGWFVLDDTALNKQYAEMMEGLCDVFDSAEKCARKGFSLVVIAWTDGNITIPLGFHCWFAKEIAKDDYKTKIVLAQELIQSYWGKIPADCVLLDGLYCSCEMIVFFLSNKIHFEMRIPKNRIVIIAGLSSKLSQHPLLKLPGNTHAKTSVVSWHGLQLFVTAQKRTNHGEKEIVYQVSSLDILAKEHVLLYQIRWLIETVFRTTKQYLGIGNCSALSIEKQKAHFYAVFYCYSMLQINRTKCKNSNIETIINRLREGKPSACMRLVERSNQILLNFA